MNRSCDTCRVCCIAIPVDALNKPGGVPCEHLDRKRGCLIYQDRPQACGTFQCSWLAEDIPKKHLRPDDCGIVFETVAIGQRGGEMLTCLWGMIHSLSKAKASMKHVAKLARPGRPVCIYSKTYCREFGEPDDLATYRRWLQNIEKTGKCEYHSLSNHQSITRDIQPTQIRFNV